MGVTSLSHVTRITTSRWQGQAREVLSEGSRSAKVRADGQKSHRRPSARASQHLMTKPRDTVHRVNAAVVHGEFMLLLGEICEGWRREPIVEKSQRGRLAYQGPGVAGCCHPRRAKQTTTTSDARSATRSNARGHRTEVSKGRSSRGNSVKGRTLENREES